MQETDTEMIKRPTRLHVAGSKYWAEYSEIVPAGVPLEMVMSRAYWKKVEDFLRPNDTISIVAEDFAFDGIIRLKSKSPDGMLFRWTGGVKGYPQ
jgi:hypothetical protein